MPDGRRRSDGRNSATSEAAAVVWRAITQDARGNDIQRRCGAGRRSARRPRHVRAFRLAAAGARGPPVRA